jgi:hypothetical protein
MVLLPVPVPIHVRLDGTRKRGHALDINFLNPGFSPKQNGNSSSITISAKATLSVEYLEMDLC